MNTCKLSLKGTIQKQNKPKEHCNDKMRLETCTMKNKAPLHDFVLSQASYLYS